MKIGILGYSLMCAAGNSVDAAWSSLLRGEVSQGRFMVNGKSEPAYLIDVGWVPFNRLQYIAEQTAAQAMLQAGMPIEAIVVGSTSASFSDVENGEQYALPGNLATRLGSVYGSTLNYHTGQACAASSHAIAFGTDLILSGAAQVVLVGGADEVTRSAIAAFEAVRLYGTECRPFDKDRAKLVLGEGAAFFVLAAEGIGNPVAYLEGVGISTDAMDPASPAVGGIQRAILEAMFQAQNNVVATGIDFICAHGTGTKLNDLAESQAIRGVWGENAPLTASYKGALGHPQGASGAVGLALTIKALQTGIAFPTWRLETKDPEIEVPVSPLPIVRKMTRAMVLSSGSWGANAALIVAKAE